MEKINEIDDYIKKLPETAKEKICKLRTLTQKLYPQAQEAIKYGIPTFLINKKSLIHFAAYKKHVGVYPGPEVIKSLKEELTDYPTSKGAIQFNMQKPLPLNLIKRILKERYKAI